MHTSRFHSIQSRLALIFSLLFLTGMLILAVFIKFAADAGPYNALAHDALTQARQLYRAKLAVQHFQAALRQYMLTSDPDWLDEYTSSYSRLPQYLAIAASEQPDDAASLQQLSADLAVLRELTDQIIAAVDQAETSDDTEDWITVDDLDAEASEQIEVIVTRIDAQVATQNLRLEGARRAVNTFSAFGLIAMLVALPLFLVLLGIAVWVINQQVSAPLKHMIDGLPHILDGSFSAGRLSGLSERQDEIGFLAREYLHMAAAVQERRTGLQQQAEELRLRIRP